MKLRKILDYFFPPKLRNKAGGMAWIKTFGGTHGADVLAMRPVKTVRLRGHLWEIEPRQFYTVRGFGVHCNATGCTAFPGDSVVVSCLADELLEPWKEDGITQDDVQELYQPGPRIKQPETAQ